MTKDPRIENEARLEQILEGIVALAAGDRTRRIFVGDGETELDGIATAINMLADELDREHRVEAEHRRRAQRAERLALVGQLSATIGHEISAPAACVLANLGTLDDHLDLVDTWARGAGAPPDVLAALRDARSLGRENAAGVDRIARIVRELRGISRGTSGRLARVALAQVVDDAVLLVRRELTYRAQLVVQCPPEAVVVGDAARLVQLVTNLLANAAQAIPEGDPRAHRVAVEVAPSGEFWELRVSDTGWGIAHEVGDRVFEPFFTTRTREGGTGLGLSVCAEIATQHAGKLRYTSEPGEGTTFFLTIPRSPGELSAPRTSDAPSTPRVSIAPTEKPRVLLVDDEAPVLEAFARALARSCRVITDEGGRAAIDRLAGDRAFDLVVCDLAMPNVDGPAVYEWASLNAPELLPRIVFTSGGTLSRRTTEFLARFHGEVLDKPVRRQAVLDAVARARVR